MMEKEAASFNEICEKFYGTNQSEKDKTDISVKIFLNLMINNLKKNLNKVEVLRLILVKTQLINNLIQFL